MNNQSKSAVSAEGVYSNGRLMHTMTSLVGNVAQVVLKDGKVYEGVLKTFSPKVSTRLCISDCFIDKLRTVGRGFGISYRSGY